MRYHFHSHAWEFIHVDGINALFAARHHHKLCTAEVQYSVLNKPHSQNNDLLMDIVFLFTDLLMDIVFYSLYLNVFCHQQMVLCSAVDKSQMVIFDHYSFAVLGVILNCVNLYLSWCIILLDVNKLILTVCM